MKRLRAAGIIIKGNKILLMHRRKEGKEYWVIPGGKVEDGETAEQAVHREIKEELTLAVVQCTQLFETDDPISHTLFFTCQVENKAPILGGPESIRRSADNWYNPEWVTLNKISHLDILPDQAKSYLLSL